MPVTKSAKRALRTSTRRHEENATTRDLYKKAVKNARKAILAGTEGVVSSLLDKAASALDRAAKNNTIHRNKAARLKSRLAKKAAVGIAAAPEKKARTTAKKVAGKAVGAKKSTKKAAPKKK